MPFLHPAQLIEDKKMLSEKCEAVVAELKQVDQKYSKKITQMQEQHELVRGWGRWGAGRGGVPWPELVGFAQMGSVPELCGLSHLVGVPLFWGAFLCAQKVCITHKALPWLPRRLLSLPPNARCMGLGGSAGSQGICLGRPFPPILLWAELSPGWGLLRASRFGRGGSRHWHKPHSTEEFVPLCASSLAGNRDALGTKQG